MKKSHFLPVYEDNLLHDLSKLLPRWSVAPADRRTTAALCATFRQAAIASLLQTAASGTFRLRLQRSASAYLVHLAATAADHQRRSKALPFFDALAAGDVASARQIAQRVTPKWVDDVEAEENYLAIHGPMRVLEGADDEELERLAVRWEAAVAGDEEPRIDALRALISRDAKTLREAVTDFLGAWRKSLDDESRHSPEAWATEAVVSVEALAFLRLGALRGATVTDELRGAPKVARDDSPLTWHDDSHLVID